MITDLEHIGNIPVSTSAVASLFPEMKAGNQKVRNLEAAGQIIRLKKRALCSQPEGVASGSVNRVDSEPSLCPLVCI